jgi:hypothetical protein
LVSGGEDEGGLSLFLLDLALAVFDLGIAFWDSLFEVERR